MNQPAVLTTNTNNKTQQQQQQQQQQQHTPQPLQQHQRCYYTATANTAALAAVVSSSGYAAHTGIHAEDFTPAQMCELPLDNYPDLKPVPAWEAICIAPLHSATAASSERTNQCTALQLQGFIHVCHSCEAVGSSICVVA
eukprot:19730-Heterococcus_DN1.PRE.2